MTRIAITVRVYGNSLEIIRAKAEEIRASMAKIPGIEDPRVELQVEEPSIEVKVDIDRAASYGLKPGDVRRATSAMVGGITVGALFEDQKVFDVVVWGRPELRDNIDDVRNLMINSESGSQVRLARGCGRPHRAGHQHHPATGVLASYRCFRESGRAGAWRCGG